MSVQIMTFFGESAELLDDDVNKFLSELEEGEFIDIKFCSDPQWFNVIVLYNEYDK